MVETLENKITRKNVEIEQLKTRNAALLGVIEELKQTGAPGELGCWCGIIVEIVPGIPGGHSPMCERARALVAAAEEGR